jgi:hypothetical protein
MTYLRKTLAVLAMGAMAAGVPAAAKSKAAKASRVAAPASAKGTPQRDTSRISPGLARLLASPNNGIARALIATEGSNSRLQDNPASP